MGCSQCFVRKMSTWNQYKYHAARAKAPWGQLISSGLPWQSFAMWVKSYEGKDHVLPVEVRGLHKGQGSLSMVLQLHYCMEHNAALHKETWWPSQKLPPQWIRFSSSICTLIFVIDNSSPLFSSFLEACKFYGIEGNIIRKI